MNVPIVPEAAQMLTFQQYGPQPEIDGVTYKRLVKHRALEGSFTEFLRITDGLVEGAPEAFKLRQVSLSEAGAGRINAFHVHPKEVQNEVFCVPRGTLLVWLVDMRVDSSTAGNRRRVILSGEEPGLLFIPAGVAHGYKAGNEGALLIYAMNTQFNLEDPNEGRLPWDYFGTELWEDDRG